MCIRDSIEGDPEQMWEKFLPVLEKKGETDDMDYKHNVYVYQTEWANRVAADYGSVFQPITDYMNTGAPTSMPVSYTHLGHFRKARKSSLRTCLLYTSRCV